MASNTSLETALKAVLSEDFAPGDPPPGGCLAVRTPSGTSWVAQGHRVVIGVDQPLPMTFETAFDLGSVTKVMATTTALMALVDQGVLRRDDRIGRFLPQLRPPLADLGIDRLLLHRAGLWEWRPLYLRADTHEQVIGRIGELELRYPPSREPATGRHYSDLGFLLLGAVVAAAWGAPLTTAVSALVLEPWRLDSTRYAAPPAGPVAATSIGDRIEREMIDTQRPYPVPERSSDFSGWRTRPLIGEVNDGNACHGCHGVAGHAGLFSSVPDLLTFGHGLLRSLDGAGPLSAGTLGSFLTEGPDPGQARGFWVETSTVADCSAPVYGHPGFPGVSVAIMPRHRASIVLATNRLHVLGSPRPHAPSWQAALRAAHQHLHDTGG